jgi:hypothetical protein
MFSICSLAAYSCRNYDSKVTTHNLQRTYVILLLQSFVLMEHVGMQVETILLSIISMLSSPNDESPANIDAAVSYWLSLEFSC